ncbi:TLD-domain-containing protein [Imleria badia]|nr:TLD-domain-containing protein [Imleria badia]
MCSSASTLASGSHPAHATLSRISSSLVSLLPPASTRPRSTTPTIPSIAPLHAPSTTPRFHASSTALTHGSPFSATPYIPPTGAPGFAGDRAWDRGFSEVLEQEEKRGLGVTLVGRREGTVGVLTEEMVGLIRPHLPALTKLPRHWTLLYSLDQHGISLNTLYARCEPRVPSRAHPNPPKGGLVVVRDADEAVFGAWVSEGVRVEKGGYYGSGEACVVGGRLDVYNWTGANAYVALCEPGFISFGGGDGHYGLYLDASLLDGSSASCPTFENPPLCGRERDREQKGGRGKREVSFECVGLEVWGIGPG